MKAATDTKRKVYSQVQSEDLINERRERIIQAAIRVFHRSGFHVATTADIAKEAGLTQSNLYNYVSSKQDVLFLVCAHLVGLYEKSVQNVVEHYEDPYDRLVEALRAIIRVMGTYKDEIQLLYNETRALEKADRKVVLSSIAQFITRFQDLLNDYEGAHGNTLVKNKRIAANFLTFVPAMIALRSWDLSSSVTNEEIELSILQFTLSGLGVPLPTSMRGAHRAAIPPPADASSKRRKRSRVRQEPGGGDARFSANPPPASRSR